MKRHRLLPHIKIPKPCPKSWDDMQGDNAKRFCSGCSKPVYNLSTLTSDEAEKLLYAKEGNLCVAYRHKADGSVIHRSRGISLISIFLSLLSLLGLTGCATSLDKKTIGRASFAPAKPCESEKQKEMPMLIGDVAIYVKSNAKLPAEQKTK
jgi:hypothetical protein